MKRGYILFAASAVLLGFAVYHALSVQRKEPESPPPVPPAQSPFGDTVAGAGQVEPATEASGTSAIAVGSQLSGIATTVRVRIGQQVKTGEILVELDQRQASADLKVRQASLNIAYEQLRRLKLQPRPEDITVSQAQLESAEAELRLQQDLYDRMRKLRGTGSLSEEELRTRELNYQKSRADVYTAKANLALLKAGAWDPDIAIAAANVDNAKSQVDQIKTTLEMMLIRAPVDGTILQVNCRPGEFVATAGSQSLIMMGNLEPLHVRVNIDEEDIPRLRLNAPAKAKIRGDVQQQEVPMTFVRLEPFVVPKMSLTGTNTERVDTRVVQVIYAIDPANPLVKDHKILVGQLLDVFIDAKPVN
jgi:multidrug resistance efflux pump